MLATYYRVSSDKQADGNGTDSQRVAVEAWIKASGLSGEGARTYADDGESGKSMDRPAWNAMIEDIRKGEVDTVVMYDLSRAGRTLRGLLEWIEEMVELKIRVVFVRDSIDISTAMGRFILQIMAAVAELERHRINSRQRDGIKAAIAKGRKWGGQHHPRLTPEQWADAARRKAAGETWAALAAEYGLHPSGLYQGLKRRERAKG